MKQSGFSSVLLLVILVVLGSIGAAGFMMMQNNSESALEDDNSDDVSTTSPSGKTTNESGTKAKGIAKSKVKACDVLSIEKVSSIIGVPMSYSPELTEEDKGYQDEYIWTSLCSFVETNGTIETSAGVVLMITEGLTGESKEFLKDEFENSKVSEGGVAITGFGDSAYKTLDGGLQSNVYNVIVNDKVIMAYSAVAHGKLGATIADHSLEFEQKDAVTEEVLRHIISQLK